MIGRRALVTAALLGLTLTGLPLAAQMTFFKWIDRLGNLHVTDRLSDVPEPYYSMYRARLRELEEQRAKTGQSAPAVSDSPASQAAASPAPVEDAPSAAADATPPSVVELELRRQADWKALVARWRSELTGATAQVEAIQNELDEAGMNPLLRETPEVKARIAEIEGRRVAAMARLEKARQMLLEELPARAKKEGVPPRWLD